MDAENKLAMGANNAAAVPEGANASAMAAAASEAMIAALQALTLVPDANGQVILPAGVELDDIRVSGRDLVISLPDGTQMIIPDGAVFVPQFVLDGIAVPPLNIAALLISQETAPAAGRPTSSGGNFADPVGDIGDPFARGDLLPPTELAFGQPEEKELIPGLVDEEPTTIIITPDQPAGSVSATDRVSEAGLPARGSESPGSNEAANSETTSGSIVFQTPDGFGSVTLNGTAITAVGQVISTPTGRLTITSIAPGNIGYSYTLTDNTSGDNSSDVFAVVVTDADGDAATANLTISIVDDVPTARNDTDAVAAGTYGPETGNVLTGVGTTSGSGGADTPGADSAVLTGIRVGSSGAFVAPGTALVGTYGTLTIGANGSYSYVRNPGTPGGVNDVFSYQITDGDGDASIATLTISIADAAPATAANAAVLLDDDALAGGNAGGTGDDANAANTSGTLAASGGDGPLTWSLSTSGAPSGFTYVANGTGIDVLQGTTVVLRVTLNSATGAYTVTQLAPIQHAAGGDENNAVFTLGYQVTDRDSDAATGNLTINVDDDTPVATNDTDNIASGTYGPATGNVITDAEGDGGADSVGADGGAAVSAISGFGGTGAVGGATPGQYGVLTLNADGSYSYVRNAGTPGGVTDVFSYTITDSDGDTTTARLTITIDDASPEAGENATVLLDDDALSGGNPGGTGDDANAANTSGTLAASGGDGPLTWALATSGAPAGFTYVANGTGIDVLQGATVVLRVTLNTATGAYTTTQLAPIQHVAGSDENNQSFSLTYTVTDQDGDTANSILAINVDDDTPLAANDSDSIAAGSYGPATGNVLTDAEGDGGADSRGADGGAVTAISGFGGAGAIGGTTNGQYGVLTLNADGSYSYTRNAGTPGGVNDVFTYTLTDGDGDAVMATLTISIADSPTTLDLPTEGEAGTLVDEAGLPAGSNAASNSETTAGTIAYTAPDGPAVVTIDGVAVTAVGQTFVGTFGTLTVTTIANGAIGYSYTLTTNTSGDNTFDDFAIVVTDQDGDATAGTLVVDIIDDVPTARPDLDSVREDTALVADGNVITGTGGGDANATDGVADTRGADGATVTAIAFGATAGTVGGTTNGAYGVLTLNADGSYSYALNNADPRVQGLDGDDTLTEVFTYTLTDGDGDVRTTTLTITINGADDPITIGGLNLRGPEVIVDEDDLSDGTSPNPAALTQTGTFTVNGTDGIAAILIEGGNIFVGQSFTTAYGTFTITTISAPVDGSATAITVGYSYVLTDNTAHPAGSGENFITEVFDIAVADTDGSTDSATIEVRIIDDVPAAVNDTDIIASGSYGPATGNVITDTEADGGADTRGADGAIVTAISGAAAGTVGGTTAGTYGVLTLNADGSYSYVRNAGTPGGVTDVFSYTITDSDGDTATATLTISIADARPLTGENATVLLDDDALSGGNSDGTGDDVNAANLTGTLAASGGDGPLTWSLATSGAPAGFSYVANGTGIDVVQGTTVVLRITLNTATGAYTVTQLAPIQHAPGSDENNQAFTLSYTVSDQDSDTANGTLTIDVDDDTPTATNDFDTIIGGSALPATGNVITDIEGDGGADSVGADGGAAIVAITGFGGPGAVGGTTNGQYGVLTINADGSYSYVRNSGTPGNVEDIFTYTLTDSDGDTVTATLTIGIEDARPIVGENATVLLDDDGLAGGNPDGTGDDVDAANETGTLSGSGGDGALTWAYTLAGAPAGFTYVAGPGGSVLVQQGGTTVLTITLNSATGAYTVTQNAPILHIAGNDENNQLFTLNYTVSDVDGDSTPGTLTINVDDDTPVVAVDGEAPSLVVDETNFTTNDTENLSGLFTSPPQYGADGAGSVAYALGVVAGPSGLVDTLTGQAVVLSLTVGGIVEGRTTGGLLVFTVAVDASGNVTLDQSRAVVHTPNGGPNDVATLAGNLVTLTQTVTDRDGDSASATANIGGMLRFVDDAPSAGANAAVQLDDDSLGGNAGGAGDVNPNTDNTSGTLSHSFGNDGGTIAFQTGGAPAGYRYTPSGSNILIQQEQGAGNWVTVVTVTLNAANGAYTVTQNAPVLHPAGADENDVSFTLGYVVTDGDLDSATSSIVINIDDDTPVAVAGAQSGIVDEDGLANGLTAVAAGDVAGADVTATGSVTGLFSAGADTPLTYQLTGSTAGLPALFSGGVAVTYALAGNVLTASAGVNPVFTLTLNAATGQWDFVLIRPLDHANGGDENDIVLQFGGLLRATDADGDTVAATGTLTVTVDDDSPLVTDPVAAGGVAVDESSANPGGFPVSASSAASIISATFAYGADGAQTAGTPAYALSLTAGGATTLVTALGGFAITLVQTNATTITGQYTNGGTQTAFTVVIDPATGIVTLTQNIALEHNSDGPEGPAHNDVLTLAGLVTATVTITDRDGDSHSGSAQVGGNISFLDDGPSITVTGEIPTLTVDETNLLANAGPTGFAGVFTTNFGADGGTQIGYALNVVAGPSGLVDTLTGQAVNLSLTGGGVVEGRTTGGLLAFTVTVNAATGQVTLDQVRAVVHTPDSGPNQPITLSAANLITLTATATDHDGDTDSATIDIGRSLVFLDDAPSAGSNAAVQLDDDSLGGNAGGTGDVDPNTANTSGTLSHSFGSDGGNIAFGTGGAPAGYQYVASGSNILIQQDQGGSWVTVVTVTLNAANGAYTVTQNAPVVHPAGADENDVSFTLGYVVTDGDGDMANGTLVINVDDDTPVAVVNTTSGTVDEDGLANGIEGGTADVLGTATTASGSVASLFSAGADTPLTYQLTGTGGLPALTSGGVAVTYALAGNVITASAGANPVFTLTLNAATGDWDFVLVRALDHANGANENDIILQFGGLLQATDADGDIVAATGSLTITIDDDSPLVSNPLANGNVAVDESNANPGGFPISAASAASIISATLAYGADGAAVSGTPAYAISLTAGGATTLVTAQGDFPITLVQLNATTIAGQYSNGGTQTAFTIVVDPATGIATLTQNVALEHNTDGVPGPAHNDVLTLAGLITATVTITDRDGDSHSGSAQVGGNISFFDDGPAAVADTDTVTEGAIVTGNVLTDDNFGADGAAPTVPAGGVVGVAAGSNTATPVFTGVGTVINTALGSLTLNADGSYSYDALPNTTAVVATDTFVYTIRDADGDTSTVTLTITINPVTLVADNDLVIVDEAALNANGSNPGSTAETAGGALAVAGAVSYTLPGGGVGTYGTLTLNANGSYSYTLTTPYDTAPDTNNGTNTELGRDVFTYTATDANGNTVTGTIAVDIIDDVPNARDDAAGLTEGGPTFVTFDVDTNDTPGADGTGSRTFTTLTGTYGNLTLNGDGTQTYTLTPAGQTAIDALAPGVTLQDVFTYTLTDGDGDTDPATLTITLTGADDPVLISNLTPAASGGDAVVDEDDLPAGSDTTPESLTATGNFTITAPDGVDDLTVGGVAVIVNGVYQSPAPVVTPLGNILTFTGYNPATGVVSYSYTLSAAETHANASGENNLFEDFAVTLTDVDGDNAGDTLSIRIVDDVPTANDDSGTQVTENAPITVNVIANDVRGADGVSLTTGVAVVGGSLTGTGSLVYNNDGTFTYTPGAGEQGVVTFQYRITDADGDSDPATVTINLLADSTPAPVNVVAAVDDDGLAGNNPLSTIGDINADTGDSGAGIGNEAVFVGQINVNFGNDTGTVSFSNLNGTFVQVGTERVALSWSGTTLTGTVAAVAADLTTPQARSGTALFTVNLTPSGAYTVTLLDNVLHAAGGNEANAPLVNLNYLASDSDGDSSTAGVLAVTFNDDAPTLGIIQNQQISNTPANPTATGTLHFAAGADGVGNIMTIAANMTGITSGGRAIFTQQVGNVLTGYADTDGSGGVTGADTAVFTLTVNPTAGTSGQYVFDLLAPLDGSTVNVSVGSGSSFGVGPSNSVIVASGATQLAIVTGWEPTGGFTPAELAAWQAGSVPTLTQRADINGSTQGWGLQNNQFNNGEFLRFDFGVVDDYDAGGPFTPPVAGPFANVSYASFAFSNNWDSTDSVTFVAHYTNGTTATFTRSASIHPSTFTVTSPAGTQIAWIDVYCVSGQFKLDLTDVGVTQTVVDQTIPFTLQLTDGDSDTTTTNAFTVRVGNTLAPFAPAAQAEWTPEKPGLLAAELGDGNSDTWLNSSNGIVAPQQIQLREQVQSNSLVAASLVALAGADVQLQEAGVGIVRDDHLTRETGTDMSVAGPSVDRPLADNAIEAPKAVEALAVETAEPIQIDNLTVSQLWESTGLAPQELPVEQYAPAEHGSWVQLPNSGASMLTLPTDTGLIDALLLVRGGPVEAIEPQLADLQTVIAASVNDNGIDHLLDQLTGPEGNVPMLHIGDDIASALIDMPVSSDAMTHFSSISVSDQLQEMATSQT